MSYQSSFTGEQIDNSIQNIVDDIYINESGDTMTGSLKTSQLYIDNTNDISRIKFNNGNIERAIININADNRLNFFSFGANQSGYYEHYYLPTPNNALTEHVAYPILTKKNYLDMVHPVNSCITMATNTNPSSTLGGSWTLIDKKFSPSATTVTATLINASAATVYYIRSGNSLRLRIAVTNKAAINDTTTDLISWKWADMGIAGVHVSPYLVGYSDGGECIIEAAISSTDGVGTLQTLDIVPVADGNTWAASNSARFDICMPIGQGNMLDAACNQFIFKRTA